MPQDDVEMYALHTSDVSRALDWGLRVRPLLETVADTWSWVSAVDASGEAPGPASRHRPGLREGGRRARGLGAAAPRSGRRSARPVVEREAGRPARTGDPWSVPRTPDAPRLDARVRRRRRRARHG